MGQFVIALTEDFNPSILNQVPRQQCGQVPKENCQSVPVQVFFLFFVLTSTYKFFHTKVPRQKRVKKNKLVCEIPCGNGGGGGGGGGGGLLGGLGGLFNHGGGGGGNSNPPCIGSRPSYNRPSYNGGGGGGSGYGK